MKEHLQDLLITFCTGWILVEAWHRLRK